MLKKTIFSHHLYFWDPNIVIWHKINVSDDIILDTDIYYTVIGLLHFFTIVRENYQSVDRKHCWWNMKEGPWISSSCCTMGTVSPYSSTTAFDIETIRKLFLVTSIDCLLQITKNVKIRKRFARSEHIYSQKCLNQIRGMAMAIVAIPDGYHKVVYLTNF